ncbi:class I SAM-dependent methyltransferase [Robertmurraya korlensis]|uniref:class I SAM-dependent methyltransferase n=1 Tax=Robertmurraya korlensis TaxID=519977 RepID=UPI000824A07B|nr:methyltransferase domain-containing protein [Robertmurraya korlensis]
MREQDFDKTLHIVTTGDQLNFYKSLQFHRYEATPYMHLQQLISEHAFTASDRIVDFGCGKGRLNFFLYHYTGATVTGVEMNEDYYKLALENRDNYRKKHGVDNRIHFFLGFAEEYPIHPQDNQFYFFNPFSIHIFRNIIHRILQSVEENYREISLILYYASEEYVEFLESMGMFQLKSEVICSKGNPFERFSIYGLAF